MKHYRITKHLKGGYILEYRKLFKWKLLLIYNSKQDAEDGIKEHREIKSEYR